MAVQIVHRRVWSNVARPEPIKKAIRVALDPESSWKDRDVALSQLRGVISFYSKEGPAYVKFVDHIKEIKQKALEVKNELH